MLWKKFMEEYRAQAEIPDDITLRQEFGFEGERGAQQAIHVVQGACASAPAMGLDFLKSHRDQALKRFTLIANVEKRMLAMKIFLQLFKDFFLEASSLFTVEEELVEEEIEETEEPEESEGDEEEDDEEDEEDED